MGDKEKRAAPVSSSAFSFSLTPAKKPRPRTVPLGETTPAPRARPDVLSTPKPISHNTYSTPRSGREKAVSSLAPTPSRVRKDHPGLPSGLPSPFKVVSTSNGDPEPRRARQSITALPRPVDLKANHEEDGDGLVGVSPGRKPKNGKGYTGRLASLASTAHTSLVLFYTGLQQAAKTSAAELSTAPLRVSVVGVERACHGVVVLDCEGEEETKLLLCCQLLPAESPRVGLDVRAVRAGGRTEIGVWRPWSELTVGELRCVVATRYVVGTAG